MNHHWCKPLIIKNWKTNRVLKYNSSKEFCKKYKLPIQAISDVVCGRRKYYKDFCLHNYPISLILKYQIKDLKTGKILRFQKVKELQKLIKVSKQVICDLIHKDNYRHKHFANLKFNDFDSIPVIINKETGNKSIVWNRMDYIKKNNMSYHDLHYLLHQKRIKSNDKLEVLGKKNYKYLIVNKQSGEIFKSLKLKDFAINNKMKPQDFYVPKKKNIFEVIEG